MTRTTGWWSCGSNPSGVTEDTTQRVTYYHDANPFTPSYTQNGWGRVAAVAYGRRYPNQAYDITFVEQFSYTQAGLPTKKHWTMIDPYAGAGSMKAQYSYDNEGRRTAMTAPGCRRR